MLLQFQYSNSVKQKLSKKLEHKGMREFWEQDQYYDAKAKAA